MIVHILCRTTLRIGEVLGLPMCNVDTQRRCLRVTQAAWESQIKAVKTKRSEREVCFSQALADLLRAYTSKHRRGATPDALLFPNDGETGPLLARNLAKRVLKPAAKRAGLNNVHWHMFRHRAASIPQQHGVSPATVRDMMGHESVSTTDIYTHVDAEFLRKTVEDLESAFAPMPEANCTPIVPHGSV